MRTRSILFTVFAAFVVACGDTQSSSTNTLPDKQSLRTPSTTANTVASDSGQPNSNTDAAGPARGDFLQQAAQGGMAEVELGKLAAEKAQNAEVKRFGAMMAADHGRANAEMSGLAAKKEMPMPTTVSAAHQATAAQLRGLSGAEFDRAYVNAMVAAHEKDVAMFREQSATNADPDVKAFAARTLPVLEKHLEAVKALQAKLR
jgi:putative membrane protein